MRVQATTALGLAALSLQGAAAAPTVSKPKGDSLFETLERRDPDPGLSQLFGSLFKSSKPPAFGASGSQAGMYSHGIPAGYPAYPRPYPYRPDHIPTAYPVGHPGGMPGKQGLEAAAGAEAVKKPMSARGKFLIGTGVGGAGVYAYHKMTSGGRQAQQMAVQNQATQSVGDAYGYTGSMPSAAEQAAQQPALLQSRGEEGDELDEHSDDNALPERNEEEGGTLARRGLSALFGRLSSKMHGGGNGMVQGVPVGHYPPMPHYNPGKMTLTPRPQIYPPPGMVAHGGGAGVGAAGHLGGQAVKKGGTGKYLIAGALVPATLYGAYQVGQNKGTAATTKAYSDTLGSLGDYQIAKSGDAYAGGAAPPAAQMAQEQMAASAAQGQ